MKTLKVKDAAELVGIVAIVISLIFVGLEVRQSAAATRGATQQALSDAAREASAALVDGDMADQMMRFLRATDWSDFSEAERFRLVALFTSMLRVYESAYYQQLEGNLSPELWAGWDASLRAVAPLPGVSLYWEVRAQYFDDRFRSYVEEHMKGAADGSSLGMSQGLDSQ